MKALCAALLCLLAAPAAGLPPRFKWPALEPLEEIPIAGAIQAEGTPVALRSLTLREPLQPLVQRFATAFEEAGLYLLPGKDQPQLSKMLMLTAVDPNRRLSYTVFFQKNPDGTTNVILSEANFALQQRPEAQELALVPPRAENVLRSRDEDGQVLSFRLRATASEVKGFYAEKLSQDGWQRIADEDGTFRRGSQTLQLFTEAQDGGVHSVVLLLRNR